jgi:uncharacterized RDD family membrane protein YckC
MMAHVDETTSVDAAAISRRSDAGMLLLRRWLGTIIDLLLFGVVLIAPAVALANTAFEWVLLVGVAFVLAYYPVTEGIWGRTLGKLITGMVVVDEHGRRPGILRALVRTLLRLVEVNPFLVGGIPAGIALLASKDHQRLGDMAARTYVIPLSALRAANTAPIENVFA